jgi:hypothetical protein
LGRLLIAILFVLAVALVSSNMLVVAAYGQQVEVTGAYQFTHLQAGALSYSAATNVPMGFAAGVNVPIPRFSWLGLVGDVGWIRKSDSFSVVTSTARIINYGGGPQFTYRGFKRLQPYARCIFGGASFTTNLQVSGAGSVSATDTSFFLQPGGGVDFRLTHHIWLRGGVDYFHADEQGVSVNGVRPIGGIQLRFGRARHVDSRAQYYMAISALGLSASAAESGGAEVRKVVPGSLAAFAGLRAGDVINSIDGKSVRTPMELAAQLSERKPGDKIKIGYLVGGYWQGETVVILPMAP